MKTINAFHLKLIAITAMFINHIGYVFKEEYSSPIWDFTYLAIGLLTFPIMAYLLVQGFYHTRSRWKYAGRLALFWIVSILPFHYAFQAEEPLNLFNNVMFTLMVGVLLMISCEKIKSPIIQVLVVCLFSLSTFMSDWPVIGIWIIYGFYKQHHKSEGIHQVILGTAAVMALLFYLKIPDEHILTGNPFVDVVSRLGLLGVIPLIDHYNGQRGYSPAWAKWGFYAFYPLHLIILLGIREILPT